MPVSDVAEPCVSLTDVKHYIYPPRLVYLDGVLPVQSVFGYQQLFERIQYEEKEKLIGAIKN